MYTDRSYRTELDEWGPCPFEPRESSRGRGRHGGGSELIEGLLLQNPNAQILFVGSLNCIRHKPFMGIARYMRERKFSFLCPTMTDFASGRYLHEIKDAIGELAAERNAKEFVLIVSCQWVILSTDGELLQQEVRDEYGVTLSLYDDSHLVNGDHS